MNPENQLLQMLEDRLKAVGIPVRDSIPGHPLYEPRLEFEHFHVVVVHRGLGWSLTTETDDDVIELGEFTDIEELMKVVHRERSQS